MEMAWYDYHQNNSGGSFVRNDSVGPYVWIEADSAEKANSRAQSVGIYFDGCDEGMDCPCCGDRWYEQYRNDGTDKPELYGQVLSRRKGARIVKDGSYYAGSRNDDLVLHLYYKNGTHERIFTKDGKVTGHSRE
jgi:hypothetical protein